MITVTERDDHTLLSVGGAFDLRKAMLATELLDVAGPGDQFVVDLSEVTRIDGDALGVLMSAYRRARSRGVQLRFGQLSPVVRQAAARNVSMRMLIPH